MVLSNLIQENIKKLKRPETLVLLFILILSATLRLVNLGYSDYIGDEHKAFLIPNSNQSVWSFLLEQRKGPMQFFVTYIPRLFIGDFNNELAERIPFSLISIACVYIFYILVKKITKNYTVSLFSTFIFMVNGFIVGFGRIAQYQNLNILFSLSALYFYSDLANNKNKLIRSTLLGTLFWVLSFFSHWDAIFITPAVLWFFISFFKNPNFTKNYKMRIFIYNLILGLTLTLPFMIPYVKFHTINDRSTDYFERRIGFGESNRQIYKMYVDLYNPFVTFWLLVVFSLLSILTIKKSKLFLIWFLFCFLIFEIFWRKPGTHIYNFLIPVFVLSGFGFDLLFSKLKSVKLKSVFLVITAVILGFLYYQSYIIFVDHRKEYPWERETLVSFKFACKILPRKCKGKNIDKLLLKTPQYYYEYRGQKLPLFGFPHNRNWDLINNYINSINSENKLGYSTNEDQTVSRWYMKASYKSKGEFYFVGIKRPSNFVGDLNPPGESEKELIKEFYRENGESYAKIFKVRY